MKVIQENGYKTLEINEAKITVSGWTKNNNPFFKPCPQISIAVIDEDGEESDSAYADLTNAEIDELIKMLEWAKSTKQ